MTILAAAPCPALDEPRPVLDEPRPVLDEAGVAPLADEKLSKAFVDFQNDVTARDIKLAAREGMRSIEHIKRYTTTGMATDQGKKANMNALATVAALTGLTIPDIGLTTFRPPYTPVTFGAFAGAARGDLFDPIRRTPIDDRDAIFEDAGGWRRAHHGSAACAGICCRAC